MYDVVLLDDQEGQVCGKLEVWELKRPRILRKFGQSKYGRSTSVGFIDIRCLQVAMTKMVGRGGKSGFQNRGCDESTELGIYVLKFGYPMSVAVFVASPFFPQGLRGLSSDITNRDVFSASGVPGVQCRNSPYFRSRSLCDIEP